METAAALRAEVERLRAVARTLTDAEVLAEIFVLIAELERRIQKLSNGNAGACH
jgi:hypothetical protein